MDLSVGLWPHGFALSLSPLPRPRVGYAAGFGAAAAASCAVQLHIQNVCPDCFCWCYCISKQGRALASQNLLYHKWFFFLWVLKFSKQKELLVVCFFFLKCSRWKNYNILEHHLHTYIIRLTDRERGWRIGKADSRAVSELLRVMSMYFVEVMGLRVIAGHPRIFGLLQISPMLAVGKTFWWQARVNSQWCKSQR